MCDNHGVGLVTLEAGSWRFLLPSWTTRSPVQGIFAFFDVKRICASSCLQRQLVCSSSSGMRGGCCRVVAAAGWEESRAGGKSGSSKARPLRARLYLPLLPTLRMEIRIKDPNQNQRSRSFENETQGKESWSQVRPLIIVPLLLMLQLLLPWYLHHWWKDINFLST